MRATKAVQNRSPTVTHQRSSVLRLLYSGQQNKSDGWSNSRLLRCVVYPSSELMLLCLTQVRIYGLTASNLALRYNESPLATTPPLGQEGVTKRRSRWCRVVPTTNTQIALKTHYQKICRRAEARTFRGHCRAKWMRA